MGANTLFNRPSVAVGVAAVVIVPANPRRKRLVIQQTTANPVRVGAAGVTAATGIHLGQWDKLEFSGSNVPTDAIYAIREGGLDGACVAIEYAEA